MSKKQAQRSVVLHGHFYQPPRENPWTGHIDRQPGAAPYRNWNERINVECYHSNAFARRLDDQGFIEDIVNNYRFLSFDIGPTLLDWLVQHDRAVYQKMVEADADSQTRLGHGNAIAQVYNHIIMPLASIRDQITQVKWGLSHFQYHFQRPADSIWLAETAVNMDTAKILADFGMSFMILSPMQAAQVRKVGEDRWHDVQGGQIDPGRPYRLVLDEQSGASIGVFFYDHHLSTAMSFEHLLSHAGRFADRIELGFGGDARDLVLTATDGESFGHHDAFAEMCLAEFCVKEVPNRNLKLSNLSCYWAEHEAQYEVRLAAGEEGRGTSWSCAHGVGRWMRDCGCSTGGDPTWNQRWRGPLREALDALATRGHALYERVMSTYVKDVWALRDAYIERILDEDDKSLMAWEAQWAMSDLEPIQREQVYDLLDAQRYLLYMYTSCGWFFCELSGIETVQNLKYAARAIFLLERVSGETLKDDFLKLLELAEGNLGENGASLFEREVESAFISEEQIFANYAMCHVRKSLPSEQKDFYRWDIQVLSLVHRHGYFAAQLKAFSRVSKAYRDVHFIVDVADRDKMRCVILKPGQLHWMMTLLRKRTRRSLHGMFEACCRDISAFSWQDLLPDLVEQDLSMMVHQREEDLHKLVHKMWEDMHPAVDHILAQGLEIPENLKDLLTIMFKERVVQACQHVQVEGIVPLVEALRFVDQAEIDIFDERVRKTFYHVMMTSLRQAIADQDSLRLEQVLELLDGLYFFQPTLLLSEMEECVFEALRSASLEGVGFTEGLLELAEELKVAPEKLISN